MKQTAPVSAQSVAPLKSNYEMARSRRSTPNGVAIPNGNRAITKPFTLMQYIKKTNANTVVLIQYIAVN